MNTVTHKAYLSWITRSQKTAKTECGRKVTTSKIAVDCDPTCPECRAVVDKSRAAMAEIAALTGPYDNEALVKSRADLAQSLTESEARKYHTVYFL